MPLTIDFEGLRKWATEQAVTEQSALPEELQLSPDASYEDVIKFLVSLHGKLLEPGQLTYVMMGLARWVVAEDVRQGRAATYHRRILQSGTFTIVLEELTDRVGAPRVTPTDLCGAVLNHTRSLGLLRLWNTQERNARMAGGQVGGFI